jgi:hypothetical protein
MVELSLFLLYYFQYGMLFETLAGSFCLTLLVRCLKNSFFCASKDQSMPGKSLYALQILNFRDAPYVKLRLIFIGQSLNAKSLDF